ncbi:hypothetical protein ACLOJK_010661 [Asimina triloba]
MEGGGFGTVFKGELKDGTRIAVKRLDNRGQGMKEFLAEVETIGDVNRFNLVRLIGFSADKSCQLLVYEYMSNGSLDKWIFNSQKNMDKELGWFPVRNKLASSQAVAREKAEANHLTDIFKNSSVDIQLHEVEMLKMIKLAAWCLQDDHTRRPQMSMVVKVLEGAMEIEPNISHRFCNAMTCSPTIAAHSKTSTGICSVSARMIPCARLPSVGCFDELEKNVVSIHPMPNDSALAD